MLNSFEKFFLVSPCELSLALAITVSDANMIRSYVKHVILSEQTKNVVFSRLPSKQNLTKCWQICCFKSGEYLL